MKTKDKILQTALKLFNEKGYNNVTTRDIAAEMQISAGNLHYHFKHSEELIIHFFIHLKLEMDNLLETLKNIPKKNLSSLYNYTQSSCEILYTYRFIFLNFVDILRKIPAIESQYSQLNIIRIEEFQSIFKDFQEDRIFKENIPDFILVSLVTQIFIIGDNWMTFNSLTLKLGKEESIQHYSIIFLNLFYPFLTEEQQHLYELNYIKS